MVQASLDALDAELKGLGATDNQYSAITVEDIAARVNTLHDLLSKRQVSSLGAEFCCSAVLK